jgi:replicative DNA helicase
MPVPLHLDLPELPLDRIAPVLHDLIAEGSEATQTPPDIAFSMALAAISTATVGAFQVQIQRGWVEVLSYYGLSAMPSGAREECGRADDRGPARARRAAPGTRGP